MIKDTIIKNSIFLSIASISNRALKFILIPVAVSKLGPSNFGTFDYTISLVMTFFMFSDLGTGSLFIREYPSNKNNTTFISTLICLRLFLVTILSLSSFFLFFWIKDPAVKSILIVIQGLIFLNKGIQICHLFFQAAQKMEYIALSDMIQGSITTILGLTVLYNYSSLYYFSLSYLIGAFLSFIFSIYFSRPYFYLSLNPKASLLFPIIKEIFPFFLTLTSSLFLVISDSLMIKWIFNAEAVGIYKATIRLVDICNLPTLLFLQSITPVISNFVFKKNLKLLTKKAIAVIFLYGLPTVIGSIYLGKNLLLNLYGEHYLSGALTFKIYSLNFCITPLLLLMNTLLLMHKQYKISMIISICCTILNIVLNVVLIPKYWIFGAACATVFSSLLDLCLSTLFFHKKNHLISFPVKSIIKSMFSSTIMFLFLKFLPEHFGIVFFVINGIFVYSLCLLLIREEYFKDGLISIFRNMNLKKIW